MKKNIAEEITNRILEDLEKGVTPWEKPWKLGRGLSLPINASTGKHYRGINVFVLWDEAAYFGAKRPPVSDQSGHPFRSKAATCFGPIRPPLPGSLLRSF